MKTLIDMQSDFDKAIDAIMYAENQRAKEDAIESAIALAKITKQKINSIGIIQKGDLMANRHDRLDAMIGEVDAS